MKFLVDAHLPYGLLRALRNAGHDARHTRELPQGNATSDATICRVATEEGCVVVSKDRDFYDSLLLRGEPPKLLLIRVGNMRKADLTELFTQRLSQLIVLLEQNDLVELERDEPGDQNI